MPDFSYTGSGGISLSGSAVIGIAFGGISGLCSCCTTCTSPDSTLRYLVEYNSVNTQPAEESFFLHLRDEVPFFQNRISKETYCAQDDGLKHQFVDEIFNICGITDCAVQSYRVWVQLALSYSSDEVIFLLVNFLRSWYRYEHTSELPNSGVFLNTIDQRRSLDAIETEG